MLTAVTVPSEATVTVGSRARNVAPTGPKTSPVAKSPFAVSLRVPPRVRITYGPSSSTTAATTPLRSTFTSAACPGVSDADALPVNNSVVPWRRVK